MKNSFITLKETAKVDYAVVDLTNEKFVNSSDSVKSALTEIDGVRVLKWNTSATFKAALPEMFDMSHTTSLRFSIYSERASGAIIEVSYCNPVKPAGDWLRKAVRLCIDFEGWKHFDLIPTQIAGYGATTNDIAFFRLDAQKNSDGTQPCETVYITGTVMTKSQFELDIPQGVDINNPEIYKSITAHCRETLVGNAEVANTDAYKAKLPPIDEKCEAILAEFKATFVDMDTPHTLFGIVVEKAYWKGECATQRFYEKIYPMAKAYASIGSKFYKNAELLDVIKTCLEYGYKHYYGETLLEYGLYGNWWNWEIGVPLSLHLALVCIEEELTPALCKKYLSVFDKYIPYPHSKGGNKIWLSRFVILSGALEQDAMKLCYATHYMNDLFDYINDYMDEGGFFDDGSFIQHYYHPYTAGYGGNYMGDLPHLMYYLYESPFYPQQENVINHLEWVFESFKPVMYKNRLMSSLMGRNVGRGINEEARGNAAAMILMHKYAPDGIKVRLEKLIAYYMHLYNIDFSANVSTFLINYAKELHARLKDMPHEDYELARVYPMMARAVQHTPNHGVCLALSSKNVSKYESINFENKTAWYMGDGMLFIYTGKGTDIYAFDKNFYWYGNPYLMPATTANSAERNIVCSAYLFNASMFAGGVHQGNNLTAGFILDYDTNSSTFKNPKDSTIYARKSYFMFDKEAVCVGSGISDCSGTEVKTVIENRIWREGDVFTVGSTPIIAPATEKTPVSDRAMHFTNMGGYVLLDDSKVIYKKATGKYNGTLEKPPQAALDGQCDFLELYISHGIGDENGKIANDTYAYAYLPMMSASETVEYEKSPDVMIVHQSEKAHAVYKKSLDILSAVFYEADTVRTEKLTVQALDPCVLMINGGEVAISDPTQSLDKVAIVINGKSYEVNTRDSKGKTVNIKI